jgi:uncharacterized protein
VSEDFIPPLWLRNPHLQSILPSIAVRRPLVQQRARTVIESSQRWIVDCGAGVRLQAFPSSQAALGRPPARDVAVLIHGWEGSADSLYILTLAQYLFERGVDVVRLNLRDHGDSQDLNEELFHSCRIAEVVGAVRAIQLANPGSRLSIAGFSLGGNFAIRVGALAAQAGLELHRVVAVCPVLDPKQTLLKLESGPALYRNYFVLKWRRSLRRKQAAWPDRYDFDRLLHTATLTGMTEQLVLQYTGFPTLDEYLQGYAIVGDRLATLETPTRVIAAADDPIIPIEDLARLAPRPSLTVTRTSFGGHCGFFDGSDYGWVDRAVGQTIGIQEQP